ncbi:hypothetical protein K239x_27800 [Planctomycetes bacterium K23_9]|uniref:Uncharacterized protein n=1 Tax=Stieleria marina TaxID=1930275 RepID=A0A517NUI4_9BACT|nr:hypothetical protein K239x_27800 [Planctomycetes bacterium K23_9]
MSVSMFSRSTPFVTALLLLFSIGSTANVHANGLPTLGDVLPISPVDIDDVVLVED